MDSTVAPFGCYLAGRACYNCAIMSVHRLSILLVGLLVGVSGVQTTQAQDAELLEALRSGGHIGLMRHSTAPGSDDPPRFRLGDCETQRNLSDGGRAQAEEIGRRLRASGITLAHLFSSQWCRCADTAELLGLGAVEELSFLNSLVTYRREGSAMIRDTRAWILEQDLSTPTILVTHQINIGALVRRYPAEGEIVVVRPTPAGGLRVVGIISAPFVD